MCSALDNAELRPLLYTQWCRKQAQPQKGQVALLLSTTTTCDLLFDPLHNGSAGVADTIEFLDRLGGIFRTGTNPQGCLIVNDMAAGNDDEATGRYLAGLQDGFGAALERAATSHETDPTNSLQRCQFLTAAVLGLNIVHRSPAGPTHADALINGLRSEVESWTEWTTRACP